MKKLIIALFVSFVAVGFASKSRAAQPNASESWNMTMVSQSSAVICRQCFVKSMWLSSATIANNYNDYAFLADTFPIAATTVVAIGTATRKTPAIYFTTAPITGASGFPNTTANYTKYGFDDGDYVYFSSWCFVYKSTPGSGEAQNAFIKWK